MSTAIVSSGSIGSGLFGEASFVPALREDMPPAQRKEMIRGTLKSSLDVPDRLGVMQGEMLHEVDEGKYWKTWTDSKGEPYTSFEDYCERELEVKKRKAYYLMAIYRKFVIELGLPMEILLELQWSKAKELVHIIDAENWESLFGKIKEMTVKEVKSMVKELRGLDDTREPEEEFIRMTFQLVTEQHENVRSAIDLAKTMTGSEKPGHNLDMICTDFVAGAAGTGGLEGTVEKLDIIKANIERAFGVRLEIKEIDTKRFDKLDG